MTTVRKNIMLGTAGHVDHGKTALVKLLTGCDTDTLAEEKQRGMTIDLGFAPCRLANERLVGVVDVPGHVDFIRNMVAGAQGIDVVILVVAADDGIMPQTREHLQILQLMGLKHGLVALTKIDLVEPARRDEAIADVRRLLQGTFLEAGEICPLSNLTGEGYEAFFDALNRAAEACPPKTCSGFFRLWVEDVHSIRGFGTVVTGIPTSGTVRVGDELEIMPGPLAGRVRHLQVYGAEASEGHAGECVALNLAELDHTRVHRGMILGESGTVSLASLVEAELQLLPSAKVELKDHAEVHMHVGTAAGLARVAMLEQNRMSSGDRQFVQLRLPQPLALVPGERFVIRTNVARAEQTGLMTVGGGRILDVSHQRRRRAQTWVREVLRSRQATLDEPAPWCETLLRQFTRPVSTAMLSQASRLRPEEVRVILDRLQLAGQAIPGLEGTWVHAAVLQAAVESLLGMLADFHRDHPEHLGMEREVCVSGQKGDRRLVEMALRRLVSEGQVTERGERLSLAHWQARVSSAEQALDGQVAERFGQAGWTPPTLEDVVAELRLPPGQVANACRRLLEQGVLVRLDERIVMHRDAVAAARQVVLRLFEKAPSFTTMDFRDALGVSRKYAVPLLDHLDRLRLTVRQGNQRLPGAETKPKLPPD